jgi:Ca-activated chloride channel family protein
MVDAKMTVSSIAVGPAADVELLADIAKWGKGRSYVVEDAKEVPQIFVKEAKNAATPSFDEKPLKPQVKAKAFLEGVDLSGMPALRGRTATVLKDSALELLATEDDDPLLAFWPVGLGRTAVFASDVKDRWASDWLRWRGYGPFFAAVVRALARQPAAGVGTAVSAEVVRGAARPVSVTIEARDPQGNYLNRLRPLVRVSAGDGTSVEQPAREVAPGRYEASVIADARQTLQVSVDGAGGPVTTRLIIPDPDAEYRFRPANVAALSAIAEATGGTVGATPDVIREHVQSQPSRRALWPSLVALALLLWFADIVFRRIRIGDGSVFHRNPQVGDRAV